MRKLTPFFLALWVFLIPISLFSGGNNSSSELRAHLYINKQEKTALVEVDVPEGTHIYWKNPGDTGSPLDIQWVLPEGVAIKGEKWPKPEIFGESGLIGIGYGSKVLIPVQFEGEFSAMEADLSGVACTSELCQPFRFHVTGEENESYSDLYSQALSKIPATLSLNEATREGSRLEIPLGGNQKEVVFYPENPDVTVDSKIEDGNLILNASGAEGELKGLLFFKDGGENEVYEIDIYEASQVGMSETGAGAPTVFFEEHTFLSALLFAFLGGLLLNLMPCVLPVVSIKMLSLVKMAGEKRKAVLQESFAFTFGVIASFWLLGLAFIALQWSGKSLGWGFQLQEPWFVGLMIGLLVVSALAFFGVFEMGASFASRAANLQQHGPSNNFKSSFFSGVLATAIATPCTGPFLGSALGFALAQPAASLLVIFTSLGLGLAFPYLMCGFFPRMLAFMPKPGAWMQTFREFLGFTLFLTVIWLLYVYQSQTSVEALFIALIACLILGLGCWVQGKFVLPHKKAVVRRLGLACALACLGLGFFGLVKASFMQESSMVTEAEVRAGGWEKFSRAKLDQYLAEGTPVFIDFTAKWCLICQANHLVLSTSQIENVFRENGVVKMKADWTRSDAEITEELKKFGRSGVPLYLYYDGKGKAPKILPQVLTKDNVLEIISSTDL